MLNLEALPEVHSRTQQATPTLIFETLNRYQHTMALKGAIDLELFTHVADGNTTAAEIAQRSTLQSAASGFFATS